MPHVVVRVGGLQNIIERTWAANRLKPKVAAISSSSISLMAMVVGTPMIATVQRSLVAKFAGLLPIRILECPLPLPQLVQNLYWHKRNAQDPAYIVIRKCFEAAAASLA